MNISCFNPTFEARLSSLKFPTPPLQDSNAITDQTDIKSCVEMSYYGQIVLSDCSYDGRRCLNS